ncbi:MFS transporter [Trinickia symbiotica]|uniref:MFS transporter n=1 Tax=Trinickia symbiotica TaxID=863227 RepID=A0A2N7XB85_9BURK|nr:MFS transporter [Trinickia symbiotica]
MRFPSFRKLLIGQGLSMAGDAVCLAALPVAMLHARLSGQVFGLVMAAVGLGTVIGAAAGGVLADRRSPRQVLIATDTARGVAQVVAAALIVSDAPPWSLVLVYLIFGIGIGASRPCTQVLLINLLPRRALVAGNGAMNFLDNLVAVIFPATVGVTIIIWNPVLGIVIDGVTFFGAAAFTAFLPEEGKLDFEGDLKLCDAMNGIMVIAGNSQLLLGFVATLVVNVLCFPVFLVVAPYAVSDRFGDVMWGVCLAASGLGACFGSVITVLVAGHRHLKPLALTCGLFLGGAMSLLALGDLGWMVVLGAALVGVVEASWLTGWATAMQMLSPERDVGKVVAVDTFVTSGAHPFVYLGGGFIGETLGYSHTLAAAGAVSAVATATIGLIAIGRGQ